MSFIYKAAKIVIIKCITVKISTFCFFVWISGTFGINLEINEHSERVNKGTARMFGLN